MTEGTPVTEFEWPAERDIGLVFTMNCRNHPDLRWSTKHPTYRNVYYLGLAEGVERTKENLRFMVQECDCEWEDLVVIGREG